MSLFDLIKYPVDDVFDSEQLSVLPKDIIVPFTINWIMRTGYISRMSERPSTLRNYIENRLDQVGLLLFVATIYYVSQAPMEFTASELGKMLLIELRTMITEYDAPND